MGSVLSPLLERAKIDVSGYPSLRYFYITLGFVLLLTMSGLFFGWSSIVLIFQQEGVYSELCNNSSPSAPAIGPSGPAPPVTNGSNVAPVFDDTTMCKAQELRFNLVFNVGLLGMFMFSPFYGYIVDAYGSRASTSIASALTAAGFMCVAFGYHTATLDLLIPGFLLISGGGYGSVISLMPLGKLLPNYVPIVLSLYNIAFDSSPLIFYLYVKVYQVHRITPHVFFLAFLILPLISLVLSIFWPRGYGEPASSKTTKDSSSSNTLDEIELENTAKHESEHHDSEQVTLDLDAAPSDAKTIDSEQPIEETSELGPTNLFHVPFKKQLFSIESIGCCAFHVNYTFWLSSFMGSIQPRLSALDPTHGADPAITEKIVSYTETFGLVLSLIFLVAPLIGWSIYRLKMVNSVFVHVGLAMAWSISKLVPSLEFQIVTFVIFAIVRAWYYSIIYNIVTQLFGWGNVGKIWGIYAVISGCFSFIFYGVSWCVVNFWNGSYLIPNIIELLMITASMSFAVFLWIRKRNWENSELAKKAVSTDSNGQL